jgi:hypothetical protein
VYKADGSLIYEEVLPAKCSIAAVPVGNTGAEQILVGGEGTVWSYTAK